MIRIKVAQPGTPTYACVLHAPVLIGRGEPAHLRVNHWRIARSHAVLTDRRGTLWIRDLDTWLGTWVNDKRIVAETPLNAKDTIRLGPVSLQVAWCASAEPSPANMPAAPFDAAPAENQTQEAFEGHVSGNNSDAIAEVVQPYEARTVPPAFAPGAAPESMSMMHDDCDPVALDPHALPASADSADWDQGAEACALRTRLQSQLLDALDLRREDVAAMSDVQLRARAYELLALLMDTCGAACPASRREAFLQRVLDDAVGLGPLEVLLADETVTEIMVNRFDEIFVERAGRLMRVAQRFADNQAVLAVMERIVAPLGRRIDERSPMVDARLADGSRVNGIIPPIALKGPTLTIRKFARRRLSLEDLVAMNGLHPYMAAFLSTCVAQKKNIVVAGGTGSGKTTLLNILSGLIGSHERVVTIEDAAELQLPHDHVVSLEARPVNVEGEGLVTIRDLVRNALRMRPDRIVVGECRAGEAFDMLAAMNTGHAGSLTTLHANSPRDALARLETMILMAGMGLPLAAIREHIASGVDLVVQQARREDGARLMIEVSEVTGMESGQIQLQPLFQRQKHLDNWRATGVVPQFTEQWREEGIRVDPAWFRLGLSDETPCSGFLH